MKVNLQMLSISNASGFLCAERQGYAWLGEGRKCWWFWKLKLKISIVNLTAGVFELRG